MNFPTCLCYGSLLLFFFFFNFLFPSILTAPESAAGRGTEYRPTAAQRRGDDGVLPRELPKVYYVPPEREPTSSRRVVWRCCEARLDECYRSIVSSFLRRSAAADLLLVFIENEESLLLFFV